MLLSDALAEPGVPTVYKVGSATYTLTRRDDGHMLTDARGRGRVSLAWLGADEDEWDPRLSMFDPSGVRSPVSRWSLRPSTPTGTLQARTLADQTQAMRDLVGADHRGPVIAIHSPRECQVPECDIPPVRLVVLGEAQSQRSARVDVAARSWSLPYRAVDPRETKMSGAAPVVTWGEWEALGDALLAKWGVADGTVEVRRNLCKNPISSTVTSATGYGSANSATVEFIGTGIRGVRVKCAAGGIPSSGVSIQAALDPVTAVNQPHTVSVEIEGVVADSWFLSAQGAWVGGANVKSNMVFVPAGDKKRVTLTFTPTTSTGALYVLRNDPNVASEGIVRRVLFTTYGGPYFDGSYSPDPDLTPSWTGTPNASASVLKVASGWQHYSALDLCRTIAGMPA